MVFNGCRTIKIVSSRQIWNQALCPKSFKLGQSWGHVFERKEDFHKEFELVAPLANKKNLPKKVTRRYQYFWVLLCTLWSCTNNPHV